MLLNCGAGEDSFFFFLEKTLESTLDSREIKPVHPKRNQPWIFSGRTEGEAPILWPPDAKSWLIREDPDAGKDWGQEEKGTTEDEMVGWLHWVNGHESEQSLRVGERQGSQTWCNPWGHRVGYKLATEQQQHRKTGCCLACVSQEHLLWKATLWGCSGSLWRDPQQAAGSSGGHLARNWDLQVATRLGLEATLPAPVKLEMLAAPGHSLTVDSYERPQARLAKSLLGSWSSESVRENVCCFKVLSVEVICHIRLEN